MLNKILNQYMEADQQCMSGNEIEAHVRSCIDMLHSRCGVIFTANDHPTMRLRIDTNGIRINPEGFAVVPVEAHNPDGFSSEEWTLWGKFSPSELFMTLQPLIIINPIPTRAMFDDAYLGNGVTLASDAPRIERLIGGELDRIERFMADQPRKMFPVHEIIRNNMLLETTTDTQKAFELFRKFAAEESGTTFVETAHMACSRAYGAWASDRGDFAAHSLEELDQWLFDSEGQDLESIYDLDEGLESKIECMLDTYGNALLEIGPMDT